ncbi:hypothetical protein [Candidatus Erwinia dacicola]
MEPEAWLRYILGHI